MVTKSYTPSEKFAMSSQIRRAAISIHLNIAEGCSRKTQKERNRFFEIARGSVIEVDAAIGIAYKIGYVTNDAIQPLGKLIINTFKLLSGLIRYDATHN